MLENLNLQKIVLIVAIVSFIFAVTIIYYKSVQENKNVKLPRVTTKCPDYWNLSSNGICVNANGMNKGTFTYATCDGSGSYPCCAEGTCYINQITGDQKKWAKENKFVWDGIYNG